MSDQGDAGQWRPATSHSGQYSAPDDTTGPLPAVPAEDTDSAGFPPANEWSTADDDAPTGGFPAVPASDEPQPQTSAERAPFEPADPSAYESANDTAYDSRDDSWRSFGSTTDDAEPASEAKPESFGSSFDRFGPGPLDESPSSFGSFDDKPSSFGSGSFDDKPFESSFGSGSFDDKPFESSFGSGPVEETPSSFASGSFDDKPLESSYGRFDAGESSYGQDTLPPETPSTYDLPKPAPDQGVTAEEQAAENDFFASDDHPPMWDKVVAPTGPPPKPGKPSSGNLRLPDWMRDENNAGGPPAATAPHDDEDGRSRRPLFLGLGILVAGLVAVTAVYLLKGKGDTESASHASAPTPTQAPSQAPQPPAKNQQPRKALMTFKGTHTKAIGRINDQRSGLSYPRLAQPWALPAKKSPMTELGFSASQFAVTEKSGTQPKHWARLMSAQLDGVAKDAYSGPGSERDAVTQVAQMYEARMFGFRHTKKLLASQPLDIGGHKGWLVGYNVKYHRPGVKATGDIVTVALVDTGKKAPGVLFMSVPNTNRQLWPDVNFVLRSLKVT